MARIVWYGADYRTAEDPVWRPVINELAHRRSWEGTYEAQQQKMEWMFGQRPGYEYRIVQIEEGSGEGY